MAKFTYLIAPLLLSSTVAANAAETKLNVSREHTNYSGAYGKRIETAAETTTDFGATALVAGVAYGKRELAGESYKSLRLTGAIHHDLSDRFYTRTSVGISSNKPVFATRELAQDLNYKLRSNTVLTVGGKYAHYFGDRDAVTWSAGGTHYFGNGLVSYRFSAHDVSQLGTSFSHLATVRLKDGAGKGSTQLWLGAGSSLHAQEAVFAGREGKYRSIALQRVQPLAGPVSLVAAVNRSWYDTTADKYRGTSATIGFAISGFPKF